MDTQFYIRTSHAGSPANKLQKAILDVMPAYCNQRTAAAVDRRAERVH
ncbi:hypothetical protein [Spirosoma jeollabukense]